VSSTGKDLPEPVPTAAGVQGPTPPRQVVTSGAGDATDGLLPAPMPVFPSLQNLFKAYKQCWVLATLIGLLLGGLLGAGMWFLKPPQYKAFAALQVATVDPQLLPSERAAAALNGEIFQCTQAALIDVWADPSVKGIQVRKAVQEVLEQARKLLHALVQGDGIYDLNVHYWHGGLAMQRLGPWIDTLLADERTTAQDRTRLKAVASLFGAVLWDDDFVPMFDGHQLNLGTANMPVQEKRLARFADFYMNLLTPPEVRFGGPRKLVSVGDGSTQTGELLGPLATGFRKPDPGLSSRLTGAWQASGKPHSGFFGSTLLMTDEDARGTPLALRSANFLGYYSVLRHGGGTRRETACWFVNGDFYRDHRHADQGSLVLYALGAPLLIDWGSLYMPQVAGAFQHSVVPPEAQDCATSPRR
jgi:hypothetical protein